jgi:single-strand DNA-binding protein
MMFNKVVLLGNLTRDVEMRYSQSNSAIAKTGIATSRKFTVNGEKKMMYVSLILPFLVDQVK